VITSAVWLVWLAPIIASITVPLVAKLKRRALSVFAISVATLTLALALLMIYNVASLQSALESSVSWIPSIGVSFGTLLDPLSAFFTTLIALMGLIVLVYSHGYMAKEDGLTRYYFFLLLFIGSMIGLVVSNNVLQMFIFWELVGLCSYGLISFWHKRPEAVKAGAKAFLMTRIGDVCLLAAIVLLYVNLGTFSFTELIANVGRLQPATLGLVAFLVFGGVVAKSAQLPMHTWLFSAMEAPTSVSCLLHSATMVKAGVFLLARFYPMFSTVPMWLPTVAWTGALTAFAGGLLALRTTDIKGVAAFSTISQIGFMILPIGLSSGTSFEGAFFGLYHLLNHAFFQGLDFLIIGMIVHELGTRDMRQMGGLKRTMPIIFVLSIIVFLSRVGIPPFGSFFSKDLIADLDFVNGQSALILLLYFSAAITFAYSLRYLSLIFLDHKSERSDTIHVHKPPRSMLFPAVLLGFLCVASGLLLPLLIDFMHVNFPLNIQVFTSLPTLLFAVAFILGGLPVYLVYLRQWSVPKGVTRTGSALGHILDRGFYFDYVYEMIVARGALGIGKLISSSVEKSFNTAVFTLANGAVTLCRGVNVFVEKAFDSLTYAVANKAAEASGFIYHHIDPFLDNAFYSFIAGVVSLEPRFQKLQRGTLARFIAAALLGLLIIAVFIAWTVLR